MKTNNYFYLAGKPLTVSPESKTSSGESCFTVVLNVENLYADREGEIFETNFDVPVNFYGEDVMKYKSLILPNREIGIEGYIAASYKGIPYFIQVDGNKFRLTKEPLTRGKFEKTVVEKFEGLILVGTGIKFHNLDEEKQVR
ncbi:MAG: hypothetical protein AB1349_12270 [Elusimicrobiota bacterium]